jgi:integrase
MTGRRETGSDGIGRQDESVSTNKRAKSAKGAIKIESDKGWLRLRFSHLGKRYAFAVGLPDTLTNWKYVADKIARQIELDILSGHFDPSLARYKPQTVRACRMQVIDLFGQFINHKAKEVYQRSLEKYQATLKHLQEFFEDKPASAITRNDAEKFSEWLSTKIAPITLKERLTLLNSCWQWGIKEGILETNPWAELVGRVKVPPKQLFTKEEIGAIIQGFRSDGYYHPYAGYVEFLFSTGCRTAEAIGLRWKHLSDDCSTVWIGESLSRGVRKPTKTNRARTITLTLSLQAMLLKRKPTNPDPDELVFTAPQGGPIDDCNFRNRAWKTILTRLEIDYRKPYSTRHSLISHALDLGMKPVMVAQLTGHDVQVLYQNYTGNVNSRPRLPEL